MVRCAVKPNLRAASCCSVEVVKGGAGLRLRCFFSTLAMVSSPLAASLSAASTVFARFSLVIENWLSFSLSKCVSFALKPWPSFSVSASTVQFLLL
jgi:hypothetical protein